MAMNQIAMRLQDIKMGNPVHRHGIVAINSNMAHWCQLPNTEEGWKDIAGIVFPNLQSNS